ncbi:hypothetical protein EIN_480640 [Entamoeba invadens IP1]|uniref:TLDc domain-containing protein n=1 Tax=Entamoeba invadens IP1 TaxID=370355 RepID=L7FM95_ENTIV|nr:hypothetical protein EIN_480640 [Entamoeba invadens IP1]ELP91155.1 hypothetical protein EIN_480640 [Entamoeba invadens IP1]|eukprot:XP_004257926.1 hypothetical protein EIN_480640 [Entamoeba invadens IP1]
MGSSLSHLIEVRNVSKYSMKCFGDKNKQVQEKRSKKTQTKTKTISLDQITEDMLTKTKEQEIINSLLKETKSKHIEIIYNSELTEFDQRNIRTKIIGEQKIIFLVVTDRGSIFGFYQNDLVDKMKCCKQIKATSEDFFLFGSPYVYQTLEFYRRNKQIENKNTTSFTLYEDNNNLVLSCYSSFWITKNGQIGFNLCAKEHYNLPQINQNVFTGKQKTETTLCEKLLILKCL